MPFTLPENCKIVEAAPTAAANAVAYDILCCKNVHKLWFVIYHQGTNDTDLTLSLIEAKQVAGTTTTAVTATFPIWVDANSGTASDTLVRQTNAASYKIDTGSGTNQLVVIEWDPAKFSDGYDCIQLKDANGNAGNYVTALAIMQMRYEADQPPAVITD